MHFFVSWSHSDPIYSDYFNDCNILISTSGVSSSFNLGSWPNKPKRIIIDSGAYYYINNSEYRATQKSIFFKQKNIIKNVQLEAVICHLDHPISPKMSDQVTTFLSIEKTLGNAYEFLKLFKHYLADTHGLTKPLAVIQGTDENSIKFCASELKGMGYKLFGLGSLAALYNPVEIVNRIEAAAQVVSGENLHIFGISRLDIIKQLKAIKIRSVDSSRPIKAAIHNAVFYSKPFRVYGIKGAKNDNSYSNLLSKPLPCPCPVCQSNLNLLIKTGNNKTTKARALHNYFHLVRQIESISL